MRPAPRHSAVPALESVEGDAAFLTIAGRRLPAETVLAALVPQLLPARFERMVQVLAARTDAVALGVENLHHSHNGAACIRTAEGLGLQDLVTVESQNVFPLYDGDVDAMEAKKITKLTDRWMSVHRLGGAAELRAFADARGMRIWGAAPLGTATLSDLPADEPTLVLFGNESTGLLPETLAACDATFRIPMRGFVESFNISVSVGIVLHDLMRRRTERASTMDEGGLSPARRQALLARWVFEDVRAADLILKRALAE